MLRVSLRTDRRGQAEEDVLSVDAALCGLPRAGGAPPRPSDTPCDRDGGRVRGHLRRPAAAVAGVGDRCPRRALRGPGAADRICPEAPAAVIPAAAAMAAQAVPLGDWLMPVGAAVGAATALLVRAR